MRKELRFRAWNTKRECWTSRVEIKGGYGRPVYLEGELEDEGGYMVDNIVIERSTGLYDKNSCEIYEGDIVDVAGKKIGEVVYDINQLRWVLAGRDWWVPITALSPVEYEIIGNIHENQDIMDEQPPAEVENEKD